MINPSYKYLKRLKDILNLPNELENDIGNNKSLLSILEKKIGNGKTLEKDKDNKKSLEKDKSDKFNYVITEDNYIKMILLIYRIKADIPVIIMGETGCGKTSLIIKLSQFLNNGEELLGLIHIHSGDTDSLRFQDTFPITNLLKII